MKKKRGFVVLLILALIIVISILSALAFYSIPLSKLNNLILFVNKNPVLKDNFENSSWVSYDDALKLKATDNVKVDNSNNFISIDTQKSICSLSWNKISIHCHIKISVTSIDGIEPLFTNTLNRTICFQFSEFKWNILSIE